MAKSNNRKQMSDINVVPYIDVMLVLLIIFMVTAPMLTQGIKVDLAQATSDPIESEQNDPPVIVSIDSNGAYYMEMGSDSDSSTPMELASLQERVATIITQNPKIKVLVRGDRNVAYGQVIGLMAAMQESGVQSVGLITENPTQ
jgi:biopolymer transport protein TolR